MLQIKQGILRDLQIPINSSLEELGEYEIYAVINQNPWDEEPLIMFFSEDYDKDPWSVTLRLPEDINELPLWTYELEVYLKTVDEDYQIASESLEVLEKGEELVWPIQFVEKRPTPPRDWRNGHTPTKDELLEIIEPLIPPPIKWEDWKTPSDDELLELIYPLIPPPVKWDAGKAPEHEVSQDKTKVRFKHPTGIWGKWIKVPELTDNQIEKMKLRFSDLTMQDRESLVWPTWPRWPWFELVRDDKGTWQSWWEYKQNELVVYDWNRYYAKRYSKGKQPDTQTSYWELLGVVTGGGWGGISDWDKWDITVTSSGTVWTIDNNAVTTDKIADSNVTLGKIEDIATGHFLGRHTWGSWVVQQVSATQARTILNVEDGAEVNTIDTVSDTSEIDLTITARALSASIVSWSIDESKLDASVNASLDLADSALQSSDIGTTVQAYSSILANTTASFTTTQETKLGHITVTQAVDLDQMETDIAALANGMVYKGSWDASAWTFPWAWVAQTGWFYTVSTGWTVDSITFVTDDRLIAIIDNASATTYAGNWTKVDATDAVQSVNSQTGNVVLDADDIDDTSTTNKFTTAGDISKLAGIEALADVTDATNVQAAGALMDSEVTSLSGIKTLTVPDSTTITSAAATVLDDATVGDMVNTLGGATSTGTGWLVRATAPQISTIELWHATDTTISRVSAGRIAVEWVNVPTISSTDTLTNKTIDANGTGNSITNLEVADFASSAIVTESEGLASSDNDTSIPTTAAVIDYVAANSGWPTILFAWKTSDESRNTTTTLADDSDIVIAMGVNKLYSVHGYLTYIANATPDIKFWFKWTVTTTWVIQTNISAGGWGYVFTDIDDSPTSQSDTFAASWRTMQVCGFIRSGATAWNFSLQWAQNTSNATDIFMRAWSHLVLTEIA